MTLTSAAGPAYVIGVVKLYLNLPDTPRRASAYDQAVARSFFERGVPLDVVESALLLGSLRRLRRPAGALPLSRFARSPTSPPSSMRSNSCPYRPRFTPTSVSRPRNVVRAFGRSQRAPSAFATSKPMLWRVPAYRVPGLPSPTMSQSTGAVPPRRRTAPG